VKRFTVKDVAKLSGVSVRSLHFYDEIGLLKPAHYGENGYRYYEYEQLLRLQQILFYRELGFPLAQIKQVMASPDFDRLKALRAHRVQLEKDAGRLRQLLATLDKTIISLEKGKSMKTKELYRGFSPEKQAAYENELVEKYGESAKTHIAESHRRMKKWTREDHVRVAQEGEKICADLVTEFQKGTLPDHEDVQDIIARHYRWICHWWTPQRVSYTGLGEMYASHPDFKKFYAAYHPKLAEFLAASIKVFAEMRL